MPGHLLPLRPLGSTGFLRPPRGLAVLGNAFPLKLKSINPCSNPRLLFSPVTMRTGSLRIECRAAKGRILVEDDAGIGGELGTEELGQKGRHRVSVRGVKERKRMPFKRRRESLSLSGLPEVGDRRKDSGLVEGTVSRNRIRSNSDEEKEDEPAVMSRSNGGETEKELTGDCISSRSSSTATDESYLSETRFEHCTISPLSLKGIKDAGYERMTLVQEATLPLILEGKDVLAKAKTGTGKTVAFLLPAIELVSKLPPVDRDNKWPSINVVVLCPTRELAIQAASEANKLLKYHRSIAVQVVIGGTRLTQEQKQMQTNPCQILIATPGRLKDHIENTTGFSLRLKGVKILVLDEADRLLDMGFRRDIEKIIASIPKQRQTLLFSATIPNEVHEISHVAMKKDHKFINTVEEGSEETHIQVSQKYLVAPLSKHFSILYRILREHVLEEVDYKVIVFCTTAMVTKLVAELLSKLNLNVREIHSRKSQSHRGKVSEEFRQSKRLILVSSDVSARGVDYPDVTLVVQVGLPTDREQYIHRLGRTGRKGKEGEGLLMLAPWETFFLASVKDLPLAETPLPSTDLNTERKVDHMLQQVDMRTKEFAYQAWLGYYNSNKTIGRDKSILVELSSEFSESMGLQDPPAIPKLILRKMGLGNVPGFRSK